MKIFKQLMVAVLAALVFTLAALTIASAEDAKTGPKLKVDGYIFAGKLFSVNTNETADLSAINLTTEKGSYLIRSEIGVRYGIVRPFIGYEALTHSYEIKTVGADLFFYDAGAIGAFGFRTSYSETKRTDIDMQKFLQTGILWKF